MSIHSVNLTGRTLRSDTLTLYSAIGSGSYGKVYKASRRNVQGYVAVKSMRTAVPGSSNALLQEREISLHRKLSEEGSEANIVQLHDVFNELGLTFMVLGLCEGGDLLGMINDGAFMDSEELLRSAALQIIDAVKFCHDRGVFHRDLKPENILCSKDKTRFYLADFGLATSQRSSREFGCGTKEFMAPECLNRDGVFRFAYSTPHNDIWALGVILFNMATNRMLWRLTDEEDIYFSAFVTQEDYLMRTGLISDDFGDLLYDILNLNPLERISLVCMRSAVQALDSFFPMPEPPAMLCDGSVLSGSDEWMASLAAELVTGASAGAGVVTVVSSDEWDVSGSGCAVYDADVSSEEEVDVSGSGCAVYDADISSEEEDDVAESDVSVSCGGDVSSDGAEDTSSVGVEDTSSDDASSAESSQTSSDIADPHIRMPCSARIRTTRVVSHQFPFSAPSSPQLRSVIQRPAPALKRNVFSYLGNFWPVQK